MVNYLSSFFLKTKYATTNPVTNKIETVIVTTCITFPELIFEIISIELFDATERPSIKLVKLYFDVQ